MDSQACPDGARRRRLLPYRSTLIWKTFRRIGEEWHPSIRKARPLSESLLNAWNDALLFRTLATLRLDVPVFDTVEDLRWKGPRPNFEEHCQRMKSPDLRSSSRIGKIGSKPGIWQITSELHVTRPEPPEDSYPFSAKAVS